MDWLTVSIFALILVCLFIFFKSKENANKKRMPPSPPGLPLVGHLFAIIPREYLTFAKYKNYGHMFTIKLGPVPLVVLNTYQAIQEAFVGQADVFSGRQKTEFFQMLTHNSGILFTDGPLWQEHRRFILRMMRDFGLGKNTGESIVREECEYMRSTIETVGNEAIDTRALFMASINNVIARLIFGKRCGSEDPKFRKFSENLDATLNFRIIDILPIIFPFILKVKPLAASVEYFSQQQGKTKYLHDYIQEKIDQCAEALEEMDPRPNDLNEASNICEAFLIERNKREASNPGEHTFTEWQLIRNLFELFLAGTETTSTTLTWTTLLLAIHPEIQNRVHQEIEEKIGRERFPTMSDRLQLPYVCAVMDEVLRYSSLIASNVAHRTMKDTELLGYFIPENTIIQSNLYGVHHDPEIWEKPHEFYPEHFLTQEGDYRPSKYLIPFSLGKRACLGESLARMEYFLALVMLMQRFSLSLSPSKHSVDAILFGEVGGVRRPLDHKILFTKLD